MSDIYDFKTKKKIDEFSGLRLPLHQSHMNNKLKYREGSEDEFEYRMLRIRQSLEKINNLMTDIKKN